MALREVKMIQTLVAYHDGFTRSIYNPGTVQSFEEDFALRQVQEGFCALIVDDIETKPSPIKIETKPLKLSRRAVKGNNSADD